MRTTTQKYVIPWLSKRMKVEGIRVLEIGCGEGGNLTPFLEIGCDVTGIDIKPKRIEQAARFTSLNAIHESKLSLIESDIMKVNVSDTGKFDLIILKDFIEHIDQRSFLAYVGRFLNPDGKVFIGFPPWQMPYGGHQQVCRKTMSKLPWIHLLPKSVYLNYLKLSGESENVLNGLEQTYNTGISIEKLEQVLSRTNFKILDMELFLINPGYEAKYNMTPRTQFTMLGKIPYLRNYYTTCCYMLTSLE